MYVNCNFLFFTFLRLKRHFYQKIIFVFTSPLRLTKNETKSNHTGPIHSSQAPKHFADTAVIAEPDVKIN